MSTPWIQALADDVLNKYGVVSAPRCQADGYPMRFVGGVLVNETHSATRDADSRPVAMREMRPIGGQVNRCCRDTLQHHRPRSPIEGLELACRWCTSYLRYERIPGTELFDWVEHEPVADFVKREANPIATEAREKAYQRILGRERSR